jgi:DNA-binding transcriptional MerR regulator
LNIAVNNFSKDTTSSTGTLDIMFDTTRLKTDVHFYYQYISLIQDVENTKYLLYNTTYVKMAEIIKNYLREALCLSSIKEWCVRNSKLPKPTLNMSFQNKSESEYQFIVLQTLTKLQSYIVDWRSIKLQYHNISQFEILQNVPITWKDSIHLLENR